MPSIPARWTSELQSLARIIFGFLTLRHGMEQVLGFPGAWIDAPTLSFFGVVKLLCLPGGLLMMLGLFTRPVALTLAVAHLAYWFVEPLPAALFAGSRLFGSRGAPTDHLILPALFFVYLYFDGPGIWSIDRWLGRDAAAAARNPAYLRDAAAASASANVGSPSDPTSQRWLAGPPSRTGPADRPRTPAYGRRAGSAQRTRLVDSAERTRLADYSLGVLRIVAGFLFIFHGTGKIAPTLDPISLRALAMVLELVGGPMIMLGLFTRPLAFLLSGEMAFAYFLSHAPEGFWGSFAEPNQEAAILFCFLYLFLWAAGPGAFSLDGLLTQRRMRLASAPAAHPGSAHSGRSPYSQSNRRER